MFYHFSNQLVHIFPLTRDWINFKSFSIVKLIDVSYFY